MTERGADTPVLVVDVLSNEGDGCLRVVRVQLGHVEIVQEINQPLLAWRPVVLPCLLLQGLLQHLLQHAGIRKVVEIDGGEDGLLAIQLLEVTSDDGCLTAARVAHQQAWHSVPEESVEPE